MNKLPKLLIGCSIFALMPAVAGAAGTYYTGNYQAPQQRYANQSYSAQRGGTFTQNGVTYNRVPQGAYNNNNNMTARNSAMRTNATPQGQNTSGARSGTTKYGNGFTVGAGLTHETAMWKFELKDANSILRHDDISWNIFDLNGAYVFDAGSVQLKVDAGFKYGMQYGDGNTIDDDITNGGGTLAKLPVEFDNGTTTTLLIKETGLSNGKNNDGNMWGVNAGIGWADAFTLGKVRFTPSIGYRHLKYKLETKNNYGLIVDIIENGDVINYCEDDGSSIKCLPVVSDYSDGDQLVTIADPDLHDGNYFYQTTNGGLLDVGAVHFYQPGTSHSYEVEWSGPYIAMDMEYPINQNNTVNGRIELGFPGYKSTGDQPARPDWAHPKSVEDKASMFSAFHLGMGANWMTALTDMVSLSLGVTYDYYNVSGADTTVHLNAGYYSDALDVVQQMWNTDYPDCQGRDCLIANGPSSDNNLFIEAAEVAQWEKDGWKISQKNEVDSFYKSLGVRIGLVAKF